MEEVWEETQAVKEVEDDPLPLKDKLLPALRTPGGYRSPHLM